ncbi:MAG: hypothetical protein ABFS56_14970 [Pseudomonadota bacterium]
MIKDRAQKASALRYIVAKCWFPQLEVDVFDLSYLIKPIIECLQQDEK